MNKKNDNFFENYVLTKFDQNDYFINYTKAIKLYLYRILQVIIKNN